MTHNFVNKKTLINTAYSSDLATSNYHLFPKPKQALGGHKFKDYHEVRTAATQWLMAQHVDLYIYQQRTEKLASRYEKCLSCGGNYV